MKEKYGRLTVIKKIDPPQKPYAKNIGDWYLCKCKCGTIVTVPRCSLESGNTTSCGCLRSEKAKEQIKQNQKIMKENGNSTKPITKEKIIDFNGHSKNLTQWAEQIGISKQALQKRLTNWPIEKALCKKGEGK